MSTDQRLTLWLGLFLLPFQFHVQWSLKVLPSGQAMGP